MLVFVHYRSCLNFYEVYASVIGLAFYYNGAMCSVAAKQATKGELHGMPIYLLHGSSNMTPALVYQPAAGKGLFPQLPVFLPCSKQVWPDCITCL